MPRRRPLPYLPLELVSHIIKLASIPNVSITAARHRTRKTSQTQRVSVLAACSLVCKAWRSIAQSQLFGVIEIEAGWQIQRLADALRRDESLADLIRSVVFRGGIFRRSYNSHEIKDVEVIMRLGQRIHTTSVVGLKKIDAGAFLGSEGVFTDVKLAVARGVDDLTFGLHLRRLVLLDCTFTPSSFPHADFFQSLDTLQLRVWTSDVPLSSVRQLLLSVAPRLKALSISLLNNDESSSSPDDKYTHLDLKDIYLTLENLVVLESEDWRPSCEHFVAILEALPRRLPALLYTWRDYPTELTDMIRDACPRTDYILCTFPIDNGPDPDAFAHADSELHLKISFSIESRRMVPHHESFACLVPQSGRRLRRRYRVGRQIGAGAFSKVYLGVNVSTGEGIAIKLEPEDSKHPQLEFEAKVYKLLAGGVGVPFLRWFGAAGEHNAMVLDLLGPNLEELFHFCGRNFSLKTVLLLADQLISRLEWIHSHNLIHRDLKPENLLMGLGGRANQVHVIDFGLAKRYRDGKTNLHIPLKEGRAVMGAPRYSSRSSHMGITASCRDDMESLGHILIYFLRGSLPWQSIKAATKQEKLEKIMEVKMTTPTETLCKGHDREFAVYLDYCRALHFNETPDYDYLRRLFRSLFIGKGYHYDFTFDWSKK
ncbi:hypothetical protein RQP46_011212 [Phenoliferia psychrophenolica]